MGDRLGRRLRGVIFAVLLLAWAALALAQEVLVTRNVNLRQDPSTTQLPIRLLQPPDRLELLSPEQTDGYYHVRTVEDDEGWVWAKNVRLLEGGVPAPEVVADSISDSWGRPDPNHSSFTSDGKTCGAFGDAAGNLTNLRKNRTDVPTSYHDVAAITIRDLPFANLPKDRGTWTEDQKAEIAKFEGVAVRVVGYLVALKPQGGSGESTNCHWTKSAQTDWHIALVAEPGDGEEDSIVVETTPRLRRNHPRWTVTNLRPWVDSDDPVRISGWLMFDPEHRNHLGRYRKTLWEIHPITEVEVFKDDAWVDLDALN